MMTIKDLLHLAVQTGASDLHISASAPPMLRIHGILGPTELPVVTKEGAKAFTLELLTERQREELEKNGEVDFSYTLEGVSRYRINAFMQKGSYALAIRLIPQRIPAFHELQLPEILLQMVKAPRGLIVVTGPTGSGKSTTLAAMIDEINAKRDGHIITIEDPIEYVHSNKRCLVNQREVGEDTLSFAKALRASLRQDPDVILVGEMRDLETIATAITAAETGHLVFATLHTNSAAQTIDRIIDVFPPHQHQQIRVQLASTIQGVISQQLLTRRDRPGRVLATEILVANPAVRNLIREGKTHQLPSVIQMGQKEGMHSMEHSLKRLYMEGKISRDDAVDKAVERDSMQRLLNM
jgi:twitching motility protein PilT